MAKEVKVFKSGDEIPDKAKWLKTETVETGWGKWTDFHWYEVPLPTKYGRQEDGTIVIPDIG